MERFMGVLIVLRPAQDGGIATGLLLALVGAILTAIIQLILKPMSARDSTETLVAWNLIVTVPLAAIPAFFVWKMPSIWEWGLLSMQGVFGVMAMGMITKAFALADASLLAPIDFARLPIVAVLAYLFFDQLPGIATLMGGAMIFITTVLIARSASTSFRSHTGD
jgi:drug/metabolite transporter (DMT)-like permease